ncbi:hypothetical protein BT69DRAFT_1338248 [Atractiella rhizophila]|nr:hypothetical protein BT69DRAFT_1338248 [Atractiella rhizophila]
MTPSPSNPNPTNSNSQPTFARDPPPPSLAPSAGSIEPVSKKRKLEAMDVIPLPPPPIPVSAPLTSQAIISRGITTPMINPYQRSSALLDQAQAQVPPGTSILNMTVPHEKEDGAGGTPKVNRSSKACLSCRKLKTKCEGADNPPCRRCRAGNHDCVFVESKRGKRPAKKPTDLPNGTSPTVTPAQTQEKLKLLENTLQAVIQTLQTGTIPDEKTLESLKNYSTRLNESSSVPVTSSPGQSILGLSPQLGSTSSLLAPPQSLPAKRRQSSVSSSSNNHNTSSLSILADASLAAELDGSKGISALDPSFKLSSLTKALEDVSPGSPDGGEEAEDDDMSPKTGGSKKSPKTVEKETPGLFLKGILDADTAVELFRIFFDYCYIHLPILDPVIHTVTNLIAKSTFLFTTICAVASRFHKDVNKLQERCYDEAHECFVNCIREGETSLESVQACMLITAWCSSPKQNGWENRPQRAWLYFGMAVRMGMELGLFRPPSFTEGRPELKYGVVKGPQAWNCLKDVVSEDVQREALNRERTWVAAFIVDRMAAAMGRPYQIHDVKPVMIPTHPLISPLDLGLIAHTELQSIMGQVMDTFRDRIYGVPEANDEMPSTVVMKLFNSRMDEWKMRWVPGHSTEPISSNLLFYFYNSKLFLNTFPLQVMLRNVETAEDPDCVAVCIMSAKESLNLAHAYAKLGVLTYTPDVNFLYVLYSAVFLLKVKVSNSRFAQLVDDDELLRLLLQAIDDCQGATVSPHHAAGTIQVMLKALLASWRAMKTGQALSRRASNDTLRMQTDSQQTFANPALLNPFSMPSTPRPERTPGEDPNLGYNTGFAQPSSWPYVNGSGTGLETPSRVLNGVNGGESLDAFLSDSGFFDSILVSRGFDGFFTWSDNTNQLEGMDLDVFSGRTELPTSHSDAPPSMSIPTSLS